MTANFGRPAWHIRKGSDYQEDNFPKRAENQSFKVTEEPFEDWSMIFPCPLG